MIDFDLTEDQQTIKDIAHDLLEKECPTGQVRKIMATKEGYSREFWKKISEAGWLGLLIPISHGGAGSTCIELAIVLEEMEKVLFQGPYIDTAAIAPTLIMLTGSDAQKKTLLPKIANGEVIVSCGLGEEIDAISSPRMLTALVADNEDDPKLQGQYRISGTKSRVSYAGQSDYILVPFTANNRILLALIDPKSRGVTVSESKTLDPTERRSRVVLEDVEVSQDDVFESQDSIRLLNHLIMLGAICTSAACIGGARKVLDITVNYAKSRIQFDRPIGSFQAVKHKCADMLLLLEGGTSAAFYAAWSYVRDDRDLSILASTAKSYCSEMYSKVSGDAIQIHGGIGFTWDYDLHLYFKRAKRYEFIYGDPSWHRNRIANQIMNNVPIETLAQSGQVEQLV